MDTGAVYFYKFVAYGLGLGFGGAATAQVGTITMDVPSDIRGPGLEVSVFAAAGHGISAQVTGTGPGGTGAGGQALGYAGGAGAGVSGMGTYTWYEGKYDLKNVPSDLLDKLLQYMPELQNLLEDSCE